MSMTIRETEMVPMKPLLTVRPRLIEQFGEAFHTCFRKSLDTRYSVIAWNAISIVEPCVWGGFCGYFTEALEKHLNSEVSFRDFSSILKKWRAEEYFLSLYRNDSHPPECEEFLELKGKRKQFVSLFDAAMNCIPDDDVLTIMHTLEYYTK